MRQIKWEHNSDITWSFLNFRALLAVLFNHNILFNCISVNIFRKYWRRTVELQFIPFSVIFYEHIQYYRISSFAINCCFSNSTDVSRFPPLNHLEHTASRRFLVLLRAYGEVFFSSWRQLTLPGIRCRYEETADDQCTSVDELDSKNTPQGHRGFFDRDVSSRQRPPRSKSTNYPQAGATVRESPWWEMMVSSNIELTNSGNILRSTRFLWCSIQI